MGVDLGMLNPDAFTTEELTKLQAQITSMQKSNVQKPGQDNLKSQDRVEASESESQGPSSSESEISESEHELTATLEDEMNQGMAPQKHLKTPVFWTC